MNKNNLILTIILLTVILFSTSGYAQTVIIGKQVWTSKNLNLATYRNGDVIPQVQDQNAWANLTTGAWCYYDNDSSNGTKYGKIYNWYAINDPRGLAPKGFHIPTNPEWSVLVDYLGGETVAGKKMKSSSEWRFTVSGGSKICPNCSSWSEEYRKKVACHTCKDKRYISLPTVINSGNGSNTNGFLGLPSGARDSDGSFYNLNKGAFWWTSSEYDASKAIILYLQYYKENAGKGFDSKRSGYSVRCLKD
jgi:hypothetical protein